MPFDIVSQHAQKNVCANAVRNPVPDWTNQNINPFEGAETLLDVSQCFVGPYGVCGWKPLRRLTRANHINTIQTLLTTNRVLVAMKSEISATDFDDKMLCHLVLPNPESNLFAQFCVTPWTALPSCGSHLQFGEEILRSHEQFVTGACSILFE